MQFQNYLYLQANILQMLICFIDYTRKAKLFGALKIKDFHGNEYDLFVI